MTAEPIKALPCQVQAGADTIDAWAAGFTRICVTAPTGGGKTFLAESMVGWAFRPERRWPVVIYGNRLIQITQASEEFDKTRVGHGTRMDGFRSAGREQLQICSIQTEISAIKSGKWELHPAKLVLVDEGHLFNNPFGKEILRRHHEAGALIVLYTATPVDMADIADILIVAGTNSELRREGLLVPAVVYAPDEPDMIGFAKEMEAAKARALKRALEDTGDIADATTKAERVKAIMGRDPKRTFGRVLEWYRRLNPEQKPEILFAPGAAEGLWFAEEFHKAGIPAAHIESNLVWINGKRYPGKDTGARKGVKLASKSGEVKIVTNRFILREASNWPWIEQMSLVTMFDDLSTYLQAVGRGLRASRATGKTHLLIRDHGGNFHRHGSPNADRVWPDLSFTNGTYAAMRADDLRGKWCKADGCKEPLVDGPVCPRCGHINEVEPRVCWNCKKVVQGSKCSCGWVGDRHRRSRLVVQLNGELKEICGDIYRPRVTSNREDTAKLWAKSYHQARNSKTKWGTFRDAYHYFKFKNGYYPPTTIPLMPTRPLDWYRLVRDVPRHTLTR